MGWLESLLLSCWKMNSWQLTGVSGLRGLKMESKNMVHLAFDFWITLISYFQAFCYNWGTENCTLLWIKAEILLQFVEFLCFPQQPELLRKARVKRLTGNLHEMAAETFIDVLLVGPEGATFSTYAQGFPVTGICTPSAYFSGEIKVTL